MQLKFSPGDLIVLHKDLKSTHIFLLDFKGRITPQHVRRQHCVLVVSVVRSPDPIFEKHGCYVVLTSKDRIGLIYENNVQLLSKHLTKTG